MFWISFVFWPLLIAVLLGLAIVAVAKSAEHAKYGYDERQKLIRMRCYQAALPTLLIAVLLGNFFMESSFGKKMPFDAPFLTGVIIFSGVLVVDGYLILKDVYYGIRQKHVGSAAVITLACGLLTIWYWLPQTMRNMEAGKTLTLTGDVWVIIALLFLGQGILSLLGLIRQHLNREEE